MAKQKAFFLSKGDILKAEREEKKRVAKENREKKKRSGGTRKRRTGGGGGGKKKVFDPTKHNCESCGLSAHCKSPKMDVMGVGGLGIMFVGTAPNGPADEKGLPIAAGPATFLRNRLELFGIDLERDCWYTNAVQCFPGVDSKNRYVEPSAHHRACCHKRISDQVKALKPKLIICFGKEAMQEIMLPTGFSTQTFTVSSIHGLPFARPDLNAWTGAMLRPQFFMRDKNQNLSDGAVFDDDLSILLSYLDKPIPEKLDPEGNETITDINEAVDYILGLCELDVPVAYDYETGSLHPWVENPNIISVSFATDKDSAVCIPIGYVDPVTKKPLFNDEEQELLYGAMAEFLGSPVPKVVQNLNMENPWGIECFGVDCNGFLYDTMIGAHIVNCRDNTTGLKFMAYQLAGHMYDNITKAEKEDMTLVPLERLGPYNCYDVRYTIWAMEEQMARMEEEGLMEFAMEYMQAAPVLSRMKSRGVLMDQDYLKELDEKYTTERDEAIATMRALPDVQDYERQLKENKGKELGHPDWKHFSHTSGPAIGKVLFDFLGQPVVGKKRSANQAVFPKMLENPASRDVVTFINALQRYRKVEGSQGILKRIENFRKNMGVDGRVHPSLTLNIAKTYRSSSIDPNIQNVPKHDPEQKLLRKAVIPSVGNVLLECDFSSLEVRVICMESNDPTLKYQLDNKINFHRDWAKKLYAKSNLVWDDCDEKQQYDMRYNAKNGFVFASFYGSVPNSIQYYEAFVEAGISLEHIEKVQGEFWETYAEVRRWQEEVVKEYNSNGYFRAAPGFKRRGPLSLFQLYNNPTQGTGFCIVLPGLRKADEETIRRGFKSQIIIEVHDSVTYDAVPDEIPEIVEYTNSALSAKHFDWQSVDTPLDWEIGNNWYDMEPLEL